MGIFCWIFYIVLGIVFFIIVSCLNNKYSLSRVQSLIFSCLLLMITSGVCLKFNFSVYDNIFLSFVFMMITDIIYSSYFVERDFFNKEEKKVPYYILLILVGFFINQEFINSVKSVFLTGEDLRLVLWFVVFVFLYSFFKEKNIMSSSVDSKRSNMSVNSILNSYSKYKYLYCDECDISNRELSNALYAIMIFEASRRSKILRNMDNLFFRVDGKKRKLGIMQVETKKFISDVESIEIVRKEIEKIKKNKDCSDMNSLFDIYYGYNNEYVKHIFEIIKKF